MPSAFDGQITLASHSGVRVSWWWFYLTVTPTTPRQSRISDQSRTFPKDRNIFVEVTKNCSRRPRLFFLHASNLVGATSASVLASIGSLASKGSGKQYSDNTSRVEYYCTRQVSENYYIQQSCTLSEYLLV